MSASVSIFLSNLAPAVNRQLRLVSPFVYSSASCSSCSVVLRILCCLFFVIYVLSLSGLRFVVSLSVFVLASSLSLSLSSVCLLFSSLIFSCPVLSCLVLSCSFLVLVLSYLVLSGLCVVLGVVWGHFWSSWASFKVIFGRLGGRFGLLRWSWDALGRSSRLLKRSWGELMPHRGEARFTARS